MALDPLELVVIGVIVVVIIMWGPKKIPELARSLGIARKEFEQAKKDFQNPSTALLDRVTQSPEGQVASSPDEVFLQTARRLGISTVGKTKDQIADEIVKRAKDPYGP